MNSKRLVYRQILNGIRCGGVLGHFSTINAPVRPSICFLGSYDSINLQNQEFSTPTLLFRRFLHTNPQSSVNLSASELKFASPDREEDENVNEFLSRFVWKMRGILSEAYTDADKQTIDGMLLIIVEKVVSEMEKGSLEQAVGAALTEPLEELSADLWRTVCDVSNSVLEDMKKERKKEKMKKALHDAEVKEMCRFAAEIGIRGDLMRELRFKWAREKVEENDFYESLERLREEERAYEKEESEGRKAGSISEEVVVAEEKPKVVSLPKRHWKLKYKIYGLDLSDPKWAEAADKIHEAGEIIWPQEPKLISGKCKVVTEKILSVKVEDEPSPLLAEWVKLLKPNRVDWITLLDKLKEQNFGTYLKVAELLLSEKSFQPSIRDYSLLIDAYAKKNCIEDAERILKKMNENGILLDIITATILVHMYSKAGNIDRAKEAFESLRSHGFQPDANVYNTMIMAYVDAGQTMFGESLMREMESRDIKPSEEIQMALLRSFAQKGDADGAKRISINMQFAGFQSSLESCMLVVDAEVRAGNLDQARRNFIYMMKIGHKPEDRCTAGMVRGYEKLNSLDKALSLLLEIEKYGLEPGPATYSVLVDWFSKLLLVDEAEQLLGKIAQLGEAPSVKVHISLCDMYARCGMEKKALQALGAIESKKDQLEHEDFERVINGLLAGGFVHDARRVHGLMEKRGFTVSEPLKLALKRYRDKLF
ncbi:hypothetical protein K2173_007277 [Erythroxylum novogranatense]|uniref:PROP1-like PPR domain-containing protein n=1 Tax=Erythroxylum novogranatense TaxID=1862640 RepID=A0AAV8T5R7_9ROSI|nr:hypothetical protein K2173_007277 [Erythroxylum novogranatense]